jgi:hypothetical protein
VTAGKNLYGQLGLGDAQPRGWSKADRFVDFGVGRKVRTMFEGSNAEHSCAILDNDQTKCWGERPPLLPRLACSDFISLNRKSWPGPDADPLRGLDLQDSPEPEHGNPAFKLGVDYSGCDTVKTYGESAAGFSSYFEESTPFVDILRNDPELDVGRGWEPAISQQDPGSPVWIALDTGAVREIQGVVTQGVNDPRWQAAGFVSLFKVQTSVDGLSWSDVDDGMEFDGTPPRADGPMYDEITGEFLAPGDYVINSRVLHNFAATVQARHVKIVLSEAETEYPQMLRLGVSFARADEFKWCEAWSGAPWRLPVADLPALDFGEVPPALDRVCRTRAGVSA